MIRTDNGNDGNGNGNGNGTTASERNGTFFPLQSRVNFERL